MKAIVVSAFGAPEVLQIKEISVPEPEENQVLVKIEAAGVNPVDAYIRSGTHAQKPNLPYTPGKDAAGIVEKTGAKVTRFKAGDRVLTANSLSGTYAEFCLCEAHQLIRLPDKITFEQGAGVFVPYATAYRAIFQKGRALAGETILIHGASGGVGTAAIQWAKQADLTVVGTAGSDEGKRLVREQGADFVFGHTDEDYLAQIMEATDNKGVEIILEMLANVNLTKDFEVLKLFGRIVVIGNRGSLDFNPRLLMGKDASVFGMNLFNAPAAAMGEIFTAIENGLRANFLNPVIGKTFPLADAARAHHAVMEEKAYGKLVLTMENGK